MFARVEELGVCKRERTSATSHSDRPRLLVDGVSGLLTHWTLNMVRSDTDLMDAPSHEARRRSSLLTKQILEAITETDDETFDDTLEFDFVALGGGVATGYWAKVKGSIML